MGLRCKPFCLINKSEEARGKHLKSNILEKLHWSHCTYIAVGREIEDMDVIYYPER